ncbi:unnamed protein product [Ceutorhynchus assimilis]|uniref:Uncharacterized protein n=1 Tax=Ceutorhynchus assimilis TaxID=467358 RepID=A0A9N9MIT4_9CUCU|nr:unnamed protein product [Ceutorhynchus assimilis]
MTWLKVPIFLFLTSCALGSESYTPIPDSLRIGVGSSAYQVEGGWDADGKGESWWDSSLNDGTSKTADGKNGNVAGDQYHKWQEDVQIMKDIGAQYYRILPTGFANVTNQAGIDYYLNLLKELKANNIDAAVTLYHWELPENLEKYGGWLNEETAEFFGDYARVAFERFGDYVKYWLTINEPHVFCLGGYGSYHGMGFMCPAQSDVNVTKIYQCSKVALLAHATAYHIYDTEFRKKQGGKITLVTDSSWYEPISNSTKYLEAWDRQMQFQLGWFAHPVYIGNWPQVMIDRIGERSKGEGFAQSRLPELSQQEIDFIRGTFYFFALNTYSSTLIGWADDAPISTPSFDLDCCVFSSSDPSLTVAEVGYVVSWPLGIRKLGYLQNVVDAVTIDNVPVTHYTVWSIIDTFEWGSGYTVKFGIIARVDFDSDEETRTYKDSAYWFKNATTNRCLNC